MLKVAIYTRKSIYVEESESIKTQIDLCKGYFHGQDCEFMEYIDEGFSGGNTNRPGFNQMMRDIKAKKIDVVIVYKLDRLSRNILDFFDTYKIFEEYEVKFISKTEGFDASTQMGKIVMTLLAAFAEMERANTIERVTDNMYTLAMQGRWTGGNVPIGYKVLKVDNAKYLTIDEETKDIALAIYERYLASESLNDVAKYISSAYKDVSVATVRGVLESPVYCKSSEVTHTYLNKHFKVVGNPNGNGYLTYNKRKKKANGKKESFSKDMIVIVSKHEGVIEPDVWLKVQKILQQRAGEPKPKESAYSYLNQLVYCDDCKEAMAIDMTYIKTDGTKVYSFRCNGRKTGKSPNCKNGNVKVEKLEKDFEDMLKEIELDPTLIEKNIEKSQGNIDKEIKKVKKKIASNTDKIKGLMNKVALLSEKASRVFLEQIENLVSENEKEEELLLELEEIKARNNEKDRIGEELLDNIKLFNNLDTANIEEKRETVRSIIKTAYWNKSNNTISLTFINQ